MHSPEAGSTGRILGTEWRLVRQVSWGGRALGNGVLSQGALPVPVDEGVHSVSAGGGWWAGLPPGNSLLPLQQSATHLPAQNTGKDCVTLLEARSPMSGCRLGRDPSETCRGESSLASF